MSAGRWPSPLDAATVAAGGLRLAQPALHGDHAYWLEGRPAEGGRVVLLRQRLDADAAPEPLNPAPLSVRTRVHEYGGGAYFATDLGVFMCAEGELAGAGGRDGALWWRGADGALGVLARHPGWRFADLELDARRGRLLAVAEDLRVDPHRPRSAIVAIALADGALTELVAGHGFHAAPRLAPGGDALAFLAWDLPAMPWDGARLLQVPLAADGRAGAPTALAGPAAFQPAFGPDGALWWSDDRDGRFTLHRRAANGGERAYPDGGRECALPLWNLAMRCHAVADAEAVVAAGVERGLWRLAVLDPARGAWRALAPELTQLEQVAAGAGRALVLGGGPRETLGVQLIALADGARRTLRASAPPLDPALCATPEPVAFAGLDGGAVHGLWWPPTHPDRALAPGERPPLLLRCHGGPTAAASSALDARTLYWTSRGFAVLDLNYRGSWGFGRDYRRALDGRWGALDAEDAVAAARWAIAAGRADPARVAITGASAGGLTALNALAVAGAPFRSAAVHYGLAELASAMTDTHKFEAGYGETLLGPWPAARATYAARSPLTRLERGADVAGWPPTLLLQGADDRVVPPDQSTRLAAALRDRGVLVELVVYPGEGHGFRGAAAVGDALERELAFHLAAFARGAR